MPSATDVNVNTEVSAFVSGYSVPDMMGDKLAPVCPHTNIEGTYFKLSRGDAAAVYDDTLGPSSAAPEVGYEQSENTFICKARGLKTKVPYAQVDNASVNLADQKKVGGNFVKAKLMLKQELRVATLLQTAGNYASGCTGAATAVWTDGTNGVPLNDIHAAINAIAPDNGQNTKLVMGLSKETFLALCRHPQIRDMHKYNGAPGLLDEQPTLLAKMLGLDELYFSATEYLTSAKGAAVTTAKIWDRTKACIVRVPREPLRVGSALSPLPLFACQFRWTGPNQFPFEAIEWDDPDAGPGRGSAVIKVTHWTTEKVVTNDSGYLLTSVMS